MICIQGRIKVFVTYNVDSPERIFRERRTKKANRKRVTNVGKESAHPTLKFLVFLKVKKFSYYKVSQLTAFCG